MSGSVKAMYNARSEAYDGLASFHHKQASNYLIYAKPQPGFHCLDLATGTGLVAYKLAHAVAPNGTVTGIDLSPGMLSVAKSKKTLPENSNLHIEFIESDITNLDCIPELRGKENTFDLITCAAALVLLPDIPATIKNWAKFLKPGGTLVTDVPLPNAMIGVKILDKISIQFEDETSQSSPRRFRSNREWITGLDSLQTVIHEAGFQVDKAFESDDYDNIPARTKSLVGNGNGEWKIEEAGNLFNELVPIDKTSSLGDPSRREEMKDAFEEEFKKYAGEDGKVKEAFRFYIGVGTKL